MSLYDSIRVAVGKVVDSGAHLNFASAADGIGKALGLSDRMVEFTHIELRNYVYEPAFRKIPVEDRILFLPHCSRNVAKCKAEYNEKGYVCKHCGSCDLDKAVTIAKKLKYKHIFIVPGGRMIKKIIDEYKPKAAIGVCCFDEALLAFEMLKNTDVIPQVVLLLKDGCKDTVIDLPMLEEKLSIIDSI
jgi:hypothetical protein